MSKRLYEGEAHVGIVRGQADWKGKKIHLFRDMMYLVDNEIQAIGRYLYDGSTIYPI